MSYETGGASSVADLIEKLRIFATANGWTEDYDGASGLGASGTVLLHKGSVCVGFASGTGVGSTSDPGPSVHTFIYPGAYNSGEGPLDQTDTSDTVKTNKLPSPLSAYHFFVSGDYIHVVVESTPGSFRHFGVGVLETAGAVTTGAYAYGLRWAYDEWAINELNNGYQQVPFDDGGVNAGLTGATVIRCDSDALSPRYVRMQDQSGGGWGGFVRTGNYTHESPPLAGLMRLGPSALTGRTVLYPLIVGVARPSSNLSILGAPPDIRALRIDNLTPGALITLGADDWKCFPIIRKNGAAGQESSGNYGLAYRVVS